MAILVDTQQLLREERISQDLSDLMHERSRALMVSLAINAILTFGILCATGGLIFWLASPVPVAVVGAALLALGYGISARASDTYAMFGSAALLIGAGMLIGGASLELVSTYPDIAGPIMIPAGALVAWISDRALQTGGVTGPFVQGSVLLMGLAAHLTGLGHMIYLAELGGWVPPLFYLYASAALALAGWRIDVRLITALAIIPFAQALDTGTFYFHAAYVFYSPESTLSILQLSGLVALMIWLSPRLTERHARHSRTLGTLGLIVANLCALVGSLWGDWVGETIWGPGASRWRSDMDYDTWNAARDTYRETALFLSDSAYTIGWAVILMALIAWSAMRNHRAVFNTSLTFAGIHAYTQVFESFYDQPLAYVLGGLAAIPLAWGIWQLDQKMSQRQVIG
ncbi:MAG: hypothetical protein N4A61_07850 [Pelagimonas sp.]|jgi:hypothetical protein|nr:hypothetical protein [Pelagimonas sp.]